ncbi:hypothetical protein jhhlp_001299 [Lomentospora prolificans]|uniref:Uncharacterized protein n=1 Tax=Lomentospora prolificans TaxID=41688 RepID=A0A2N3NHU6_9PEZI|nr:hypothetical protein jhhlp_001299 [Lomentospora prolificans]
MSLPLVYRAARSIHVQGLSWMRKTKLRSLSTESVSKDTFKFSLRVSPSSNTEQRGRKHVLSDNGDAAVVLATPSFARWLTNESFMSALLASFAQRDLQVLAAVVDDLSPSSPFGKPTAGFSIMQGSVDEMLPGFSSKPVLSKSRDRPQRGSITVTLPSAGPKATTLSATLPLANTIFQNGLESTLLASTWTSQGQGAFKLSSVAERTKHEIVCSAPASATSLTLSVPLIPVTPPRRILGCLGNILSEIEVDGKAVPASTELEAKVQQVYDSRAAADNLSTTGMPVDIWALISTPEATLTPSLLEAMKSFENARFDGPEEEASVGYRNSKTAAELLMSGFRLYRITSGGGGWGKRRGRLSLDADWASFGPGAEDPNMILTSADDKGPAILQRGVVSPGSYIQFVTAPHLGEAADLGKSPSFSGSVVLGTSSSLRDGVQSTSDAGEAATCVWGHFGGLSRKHIFLSERAEVGSSKEDTDRPRPEEQKVMMNSNKTQQDFIDMYHHPDI